MSSASQNSLNYNIRKLVKLQLTQQKLAEILQKIDTEINQTDVEWLHLKSLVSKTNNLQTSNELPAPTPAFEKSAAKTKNIDDQRVNEIQLDLSLVPSSLPTDQEEDSD